MALPTASDNVFTKLIGAEGAAPGTPASATAILYVKSDGLWYSKDDAGTETLVSGGSGGGGGFPTYQAATVATDESLSGNNSWVDLATSGPAVTITVNTKARVTVSAHCYMTGGSGYGGMSYAVSGGNTAAAATATSLQFGAGSFDERASNVFILTGLSPGSTTFTAKYNQLGGSNTTRWTDRTIIVELLD